MAWWGGIQMQEVTTVVSSSARTFDVAGTVWGSHPMWS